MALSLGWMAVITSQLRAREENYVRLWAHSMARLADGENDPLAALILDEGNTIPFLILTPGGEVERSHLIKRSVLEDRRKLDRKISQLAAANEFITITSWDGSQHLVFYGRSRTLMFLALFPLVQLVAFGLLLWLGVFTFRTSKTGEQNRVWAGLAKETAHQLGTPTSSLLGWVEFLKSQPVDPEAVAEMEKDLTHLGKVADRFSKIGSQTPLEPTSLNELVGDAVLYFRKRIPRNVSLDYNGLALAPVRARINPALFEWVVENLLKNALDALQGQGRIEVRIWHDAKWAYIDVRDTGKGIPRANWKKIFEPGFTTKTRGWGLGLSLSRRVVEDYHKGRIFVAESEAGVGTTMRVTLRLFS